MLQLNKSICIDLILLDMKFQRLFEDLKKSPPADLMNRLANIDARRHQVNILLFSPCTVGVSPPVDSVDTRSVIVLLNFSDCWTVTCQH